MIPDPPDQGDMTPEMYKAESKNDTKGKKVPKKPKAQRWDVYNKTVHGSVADDEWQSMGVIAWPTTPSPSSSMDSQPEVTRIPKVKNRKGGEREQGGQAQEQYRQE